MPGNIYARYVPVGISSGNTGGGGTGDVTGPGSSVAPDIAVFADGTGLVIADSGVGASQLSDSDSVYLGSINTGLDGNGARMTQVGGSALGAATGGHDSVAIGYQALSTHTNPVDNTAVGAGALSAMASGNTNVAVGKNAGNGSGTKTYSQCIFIGPNTTGSASRTNAGAIGNGATATGDNYITLGGASQGLFTPNILSVGSSSLIGPGLSVSLGTGFTLAGGNNSVATFIGSSASQAGWQLGMMAFVKASNYNTLMGWSSPASTATAVSFTRFVRGGGDTDFFTFDFNGSDVGTLVQNGKYHLEALENNAGNSGATLTIDFSTASSQLVTMTASCTFTFSNTLAGGTYLLRLVQGGTGSYTVTWPAAVKWPGGTAPTLSTTVGATDIITLYFDGTSYYGGSQIGY